MVWVQVEILARGFPGSEAGRRWIPNPRKSKSEVWVLRGDPLPQFNACRRPSRSPGPAGRGVEPGHLPPEPLFCFTCLFLV